jgi:hypothetical protein
MLLFLEAQKPERNQKHLCEWREDKKEKKRPNAPSLSQILFVLLLFLLIKCSGDGE